MNAIVITSLWNLATLNAALNATTALLLVAGYTFIRRKQVTAHRICMVSAFVCGIAFLVSYLYYHFNVGLTKFAGQGWARPVYFTLLISHTALAVLVPPLALTTLYRALKSDFDRHARLARWTFPIWLYVSFTGVLVYLMLYHFFPSR